LLVIAREFAVRCVWYDKFVANKLKLLLAVLPSELLHIAASQLHMQAGVYVWHSWYHSGYQDLHSQEQHLFGWFAGLFSVCLLAGLMVASLSLLWQSGIELGLPSCSQYAELCVVLLELVFLETANFLSNALLY